ncbi:hypothetical protein [uncultured Kordia sp.]|uniref:hypothetical protein n=1 Tax=uncultured Kordia sp. TaxID=507699 RepID=UPI00261BA760|nr:hypothetical protein [uncultured Kordia sp.]
MRKKMTAFVSLGLVCIPLFLSCETNQQTEEAQLNAALEKPEKIISTVKAATLFNNDHTTRLSSIGKSKTTFEDKAIHFELDVLTNYIQHLEKVAVSKKIPITGVSFVFGTDAHGERTTFMMPSTRNAELDYQESFTIENDQFLTFRHIDTFLLASKTTGNDENLILSTEGYLSFNEAVTMFNRYQANYIEQIAVKVPRDFYTKAVWYSLDEINAYITYLKKKSNKHHLDITGIDVFFGVYDKNPDLELKSNAQTVFLAASTQNQTIINTKGTLLNDVLKNDDFHKNDATDNEEDESLAYNMGQLSPPPVTN